MRLGTAEVLVKANTREHDRGIEKSKKTVEGFGQASVTSLGRADQAFSSFSRNIVAGAAAMTAAYSAQEMYDLAVTNASNLQEVSSKFNVVFQGQTAVVDEWARNLVDNYAMSRRESKEFLGSIQDLLVPMGMNRVEASRLSNELVKLAADLGSFNNKTTQKVMEDMQSALVGEYETMKKYGVVLNATTVQQEALNMGLAKSKKELTAAHRAQATYNLIMRSSTAAIGDMDRTSDEYANTTKRLSGEWEDFTAAIGEKFLPVATQVKKELADILDTLTKIVKSDGLTLESQAEQVKAKIKALQEAEKTEAEKRAARAEKYRKKELERQARHQREMELKRKAFQRVGFKKSKVRTREEYQNEKLREQLLLLEQINEQIAWRNLKRAEDAGAAMARFQKDKPDKPKESASPDATKLSRGLDKEFRELEALERKIIQVQTQFDTEFKEATLSAFDFERDQLRAQYKIYAQYVTDKEALEAWFAKKKKDIAQREREEAEQRIEASLDNYFEELEKLEEKIRDQAKKRARVNDDFLAEYRESTLTALELERYQLDAKYELYKNHVEDKAALDLWYAGKLDEITKKELEAQREKWAEFHTAISDTLFASMTGRFDSIEDAWSTLLDAMLRKFTDTVANMIMDANWQELFSAGKNAIGGLLGSLFGGGGAAVSPDFSMSGGGIINEHVFGVGLSSGKSYEFGEGGKPEWVLPKNKLGTSGGDGSSVGGGDVHHHYHATVYANDAKSFKEQLVQHPDVFVSAVDRDLKSRGPLRDTVRKVV